jgi:hypothetical protein
MQIILCVGIFKINTTYEFPFLLLWRHGHNREMLSDPAPVVNIPGNIGVELPHIKEISAV